MFLRLVKEYADRQDVTEQLKKDNPYEWIGRMNNIQACVRGSCRNGVDLHIERFTVWCSCVCWSAVVVVVKGCERLNFVMVGCIIRK